MKEEDLMERAARVQKLMEDLHEFLKASNSSVADGISAMLSLIACMAKAYPTAGIEEMVEHAFICMIEELEDYEDQTRH